MMRTLTNDDCQVVDEFQKVLLWSLLPLLIQIINGFCGDPSSHSAVLQQYFHNAPALLPTLFGSSLPEPQQPLI